MSEWNSEQKKQLLLNLKAVFNFDTTTYALGQTPGTVIFLSIMFSDEPRESFQNSSLEIKDLYKFILTPSKGLFSMQKKIVQADLFLYYFERDSYLNQFLTMEKKEEIADSLNKISRLIQFYLLSDSDVNVINYANSLVEGKGIGFELFKRTLKKMDKDGEIDFDSIFNELKTYYNNGITNGEGTRIPIYNTLFSYGKIKDLLNLTDQTKEKMSSIITHFLNKGWDDLIFDEDFEYYSDIINKEFSLSQFKRKISSTVGEKVRTLFSTAVSLQSNIENTGFFYSNRADVKIFDVIKDEGKWKISPEKLYPDQKGIDEKAPILSGSTIFYNNPATDLQHFTWPQNAYGEDGKTSEQEQAALDALKEFHDLDNASIETYKFNYYKTADLEELPPFFSWFVGQRTTNEIIKLKLEKLYVDFIKSVLSDAKDDGLVEVTLTQRFNEAASENNITALYRYILIDKELARRIEIFKFFENQNFEDVDTQEEVDKLKKEAAAAGQEAWAKGEADQIKDDTLNEEDIKNRQKFFKQCALMMNMSTLRDLYVNKIKEKEVPFDGRFIMSHCEGEDQEKLITNLISNKEGQALIEAESYQISSLVPKIRLYKVINETTSKLNEVEFIFPVNQDLDRSRDFTNKGPTFLQSDFDKGSGCGIKQFSFEFNGTNPTEARSDIKADLTLYFQSFMDFIEERVSYNGKTYRFVDLIIQPPPDENGKVLNEKVVHSNEYNPAFYRIRAEVGYEVPQSSEIAGSLRDSIIVNNKSFYLCMVDHNLNFKNDGSVEIQISYRAYVETALKNPKMDALASPELLAARINNQNILENALADKKCSKDQIRELAAGVQSSEEQLVKKSLSSILTRLKDRNAIYNVSLQEEDRSYFQTNGYFKTCNLKQDPVQTSGGEDLAIALRSKLPEKSDDFSFTDSNNSVIQFFYFGDLLYTILDCVFDTNNQFRSNTMINTRMILGSFEFESFNSNEQTTNKVYNIAYMPISIDFFSRWFVDNIISQKDSRKTFPVLNFVRNLSNSLIKPALLENCVNRKIENVTRFATTQVTGYYTSGEDELLKEAKMNKGSINTSTTAKNKGSYPLKCDGDGKTNINNFFSYIIVSTNGSSLTYTGTGGYTEDISKGRYHISLGQDRGLVKNISFSKTDLQYIKEARFMQQGIDGLLQLASVYKLNVEMFGNTLFYPGMEFYFNPYGLGGSTAFGAPNTKGSIANKLGIGGYHTITSVKSTISPGKFSTSIQAQQYYSGDGTGNSLLKKEGRKGLNIGDYTPAGENPDCTTTVTDFHNEQIKLLNNSVTSITTAPASTEASNNTSTDSVTETTATYTARPGESQTIQFNGETLTGEIIEEGGKLVIYVERDNETQSIPLE